MLAQLDSRYLRAAPGRALVRLASYALFEGRPLTTRGRWINPLVFALARRSMRRKPARPVTAPIYILGQGRSGTTILGVVLSLHSQIGYLNEPKALWHSAIPDEDLTGNYTDRPARYVLAADDATDTVRERLRRLYAGYLQLTGTQRVLDKYPELIFRVPFLRAAFPDARFLILIRNGWDVCRSVDRWSRSHRRRGEQGHEDWWGVNDRKWHCLIDEIVAADAALAGQREQLRALQGQQDRAALEWLLTMREALRVQRAFPEQTLFVRYQELTADPAPTLSRILDFCHLSGDRRLLAYGCETLRSAPQSVPLALHELVRGPFEQMMQALGYG